MHNYFYRCDQCSYSSSQLVNLQGHKRSKHAEGNFTSTQFIYLLYLARSFVRVWATLRLWKDLKIVWLLDFKSIFRHLSFWNLIPFKVRIQRKGLWNLKDSCLFFLWRVIYSKKVFLSGAFHCDQCNAQFGHKISLNRHIQKHHSEGEVKKVCWISYWDICVFANR